VFDNGVWGQLPGRDFRGSRILRHDPADGSTETLYPVEESQVFFSWIMGTHQKLPNGNRLITQSTSGRVIEVTDTGKVVWSLVLASTDETAALIESAHRYPPDYLDAVRWDCDPR
jgi:hypothetical protein